MGRRVRGVRGVGLAKDIREEDSLRRSLDVVLNATRRETPFGPRAAAARKPARPIMFRAVFMAMNFCESSPSFQKQILGSIGR